MPNFMGRLFGIGNGPDSPITPGHIRRRNFSGDIKAVDAASDPLFEALKGDTFEPEESYFSVRLVEMRLAQGSNYVANFLPMCTCFLRYTYANEKRDVPFIVGYEMIRAALGDNAATKGAQNVEL